MSEYIERNEVLKAMDTWDKFGYTHTGAFIRNPYTEDYVPYVHYEDMVKCVSNMPTADVKEVVHCKNCVHYQPSLFGEKKMCFRKDVDGVQICYDFLPDDYCKYGERREDVRESD